MSQPQSYTAADIERYHSGQLSAAEMHAMEKAALDDPFLADALEGYTFTNKPAADLSALQQKLQLRIEKDEKRKGVFFMNKPWMRVAALFILIAGIGLLALQTFSGDEERAEDMATLQRSAEKQTPAARPENDAADSAFIVLTQPAADSMQDLAANEKQEGLIAPGNEIIAQKRLRNDGFNTEAFSGRSDVNSTLDGYTPGTIVTRTAPVPDSIDNSSVAMAETKSAAAPAVRDTIRNLNVVLQPAPENALAEVVVINKNRKDDRQSAYSRMKPRVDTLEPAEGWTNFDDYIANNLKQPEEQKTKPISGVVELSFDINKNGEPVNISVVRSLCQKCDEEAIRLLKEGPKWKATKKKGKVKIRF